MAMQAKRPQHRVGDRVDVQADGVFCPAVIREVHENAIKIHYIGWDESFDETVSEERDRESRISIAFGGVQKVKVWACISDDCPYWPCIAFVRCPKANNVLGIEYLKEEKKIFIVPIGETHPLKKYFDQGFWLHTRLIRSFHLEIRSLPWQLSASRNSSNNSSSNGTNVDPVATYLKRIHHYCTALYEDENSIFYPTLSFEGSFEKSIYELLVLKNKVLKSDMSETAHKTMFAVSNEKVTPSASTFARNKRDGQQMMPSSGVPDSQVFNKKRKSFPTLIQPITAPVRSAPSDTVGPSNMAKLLVDTFYQHEYAIEINSTKQKPVDESMSTSPIPEPITDDSLLSLKVIQHQHALGLPVTSIVPLCKDLTLLNSLMFHIPPVSKESVHSGNIIKMKKNKRGDSQKKSNFDDLAGMLLPRISTTISLSNDSVINR